MSLIGGTASPRSRLSEQLGRRNAYGSATVGVTVARTAEKAARRIQEVLRG